MILVDSAIGSRDLVEARLLPVGYAQLTSLEYGDAVFVGNGPDGTTVTEAFERKRLGDALACIQDGRFAGSQLRGLRDSYDFVWLIIEDEIRAHPQTGILQQRKLVRNAKRRRKDADPPGYWCDAMFGARSTMMWRDFMHWLLSMRRVGGIDDFTFTRNAEETAAFIYNVYTWRQKPWRAHKSCDVFNKAHDVDRKSPRLVTPYFTSVIAGKFDKVGYDAARAIGSHFESPDDFWRAGEEELAEIVVMTRKDGAAVRLGQVAAKSIVEQRRAKRARGAKR